jgi:uncharacterized RDD family membrane protein YckC
MINDYYTLLNGETVGPFSHTELMEQGIAPDAQVFSPLTNAWQEAAELPEFGNYFDSIGIYMPTQANQATFWWRLLAYIIDYVIGLLFGVTLGAAIGLLIVYMRIPNFFDEYDYSYKLKVRLLSVILAILYHAAFESTRLQGSIGKVVCGLKVVDGMGRRITFFNALGRNSGKILSGILCGMGFLSIFWNTRRQAWHDELAKTYVIRRGGN